MSIYRVGSFLFYVETAALKATCADSAGRRPVSIGDALSAFASSFSIYVPICQPPIVIQVS